MQSRAEEHVSHLLMTTDPIRMRQTFDGNGLQRYNIIFPQVEYCTVRWFLRLY